MPIYEYRCDECGEVTEALRRMDDADTAQKCEHCGSEQTRRAQSVFAAATGASVPDSPCGGDPGACPSGQCPFA